MRTTYFVLAAALLATFPREAFAQNTPSKAQVREAKDLFSSALEDERASQWKSALEKLEKAGSVRMTPGILTHIGLCKENLGRLLEASRDYEQAIDLARSSKSKEVGQTATEQLERLRSRIPTIRVAAQGQAGLTVHVGTVLLDGGEARLAADPLSKSDDGDYRVRVDPGEYVVTVEAPGMKPWKEVRQVGEIQTATFTPKLEPETPPAPVAKEVTPALAPSRDREGGWTTKHTVTVTVLGAGVVALAAGAGFALASNSQKDEANRLQAQLGPAESACRGVSEGPTASSCAELRDARDGQNSRADVSRVLYITGGALVLGGAAVWLLWPKAKPKAEIGHITPVIDIASRSVGLQGAF